MFGLNYELEVEDKPEYQWHGIFDPVFVVRDLAEKYRSLSDDQIIQKLNDLRNKSYEGRKNRIASLWGADEHVQIDIERQLLTVAFALNHKINYKEVELLCIIDPKYKVYYWLYLAFYFDLVKIWNERNHCLNQEQLDISLQERKEHKEAGEKMGTDITKYENKYRLPHEFVCGLLAKTGLISHLEKIGNEVYFRYTTVERLKKEGKFPPHGVAHSIFYEDPGYDILPWNRNFSNILKAKLLNYMHDIADSSASVVYKVIIAAFCCQCFEEMPTFKSVQKEFRSTKLNKGKYSSFVNIPLKDAYIDWRPRNKRAAEDAINERRIDPDKEILSQLKHIISIEQIPPSNQNSNPLK